MATINLDALVNDFNATYNFNNNVGLNLNFSVAGTGSGTSTSGNTSGNLNSANASPQRNISCYVTFNVIDTSGDAPGDNGELQTYNGGNYVGWCVDIEDLISPGSNYPVSVLSILDPNFATQFCKAYYNNKSHSFFLQTSPSVDNNNAYDVNSNPTGYNPNGMYTVLNVIAILYILNICAGSSSKNTNAAAYSATNVQVTLWNLLFNPNLNISPLAYPLSADYIQSNSVIYNSLSTYNDNGNENADYSIVSQLLTSALNAQYYNSGYNCALNVIAINNILGFLFIPNQNLNNGSNAQIMMCMVDLSDFYNYVNSVTYNSISIWGDPHIRTFGGINYKIEDLEKVCLMYDSSKLRIATEMRMHKPFFDKVDTPVRNATFLNRTYIQVKKTGEYIIINNHTLEIESSSMRDNNSNIAVGELNHDVPVRHLVAHEFSDKLSVNAEHERTVKFNIDATKMLKIKFAAISSYDVVNIMRIIGEDMLMTPDATGAYMDHTKTTWLDSLMD